MFSLQNMPEETFQLSGLDLTFPDTPITSVKFDLTLRISERAGEFVCSWEYDTDLFKPETIIRMSESYHALLTQALSHPGEPVNYNIKDIKGDSPETMGIEIKRDSPETIEHEKEEKGGSPRKDRTSRSPAD